LEKANSCLAQSVVGLVKFRLNEDAEALEPDCSGLAGDCDAKTGSYTPNGRLSLGCDALSGPPCPTPLPPDRWSACSATYGKPEFPRHKSLAELHQDRAQIIMV
jgi:hypothetical protein